MLEKMENNLIIPFESLLNRGVQKEDNFSESFFEDIYRQAFTLVDVICKSNEKEYEQKHFDSEEIQNVIAFTGRRGTGKTSVMLTLANHLGKGEKLKCIDYNDYPNIERCYFYQLPYTDASVLEENEDLFLIILSKMFTFLEKQFDRKGERQEERTYTDKNRLKEKICNIYDHYISLKANDDLSLKSSYNLMEKLSDKYNVREEFKDLVFEYTDLLSRHDTYEKQKLGYLLICIDDIDMSHKKHMKIMQCIHQYFMIPNVIVFATLSFPMISAAIQKDFYSSYSLFDTINNKDEYHLHLSFEQTNDFMRKIISSDMRITLPSWRKKDYKELSPAVISLRNNENYKSISQKFSRLDQSVMFEKLKLHDRECYTLLPKELIMLMLANRAKIFLDVDGNKSHFMEPDSLRNLFDTFYLLYHMHNIVPMESEKKTSDNHYFSFRKANRKILLDFLNFKMLPESDFSQEKSSVLKEFLAEPIERRGKRIWDYYFKRLEASKETIESVYGEEFYKEEKEKFIIENYSFGELFRVLYNGTRLEIFDRDFIKFILASFSFTLPQFVEKAKWKNSPENPSSSYDGYKRMREIYNYTLLGTWNNDLFNKGNVDAVIYIDQFKEQFQKTKGAKGKKQENNRQFLERFLKRLIYLLLLSSRSTREAFEVGRHYPSLYKLTESAYEEYFYIDSKIDPTSFIMNCLRMEERFRNLKFRYNSVTYKFHTIQYTSNDNTQNDKTINVYSISYLLLDLFSKMEIRFHNSDFQIKSNGIDAESDKIVNYYQKQLNDAHEISKIEKIISSLGLDHNTTKNNIVSEYKKELQEAVANNLPKLLMINDCFINALEEIKQDDNFYSKKICSASKTKVEPNTLWFFLKHMDISYNVIKRAISKMLYISDNNVKDKKEIEETPYHIIEKFYEYVDYYLSKEDIVYFVNGTDDDKAFSKKFSNHPIVKLFYERNKEKSYLDFAKLGCGIESAPANLQSMPNLGEFLDSLDGLDDIELLRAYFKNDSKIILTINQARDIVSQMFIYKHSSKTINKSKDNPFTTLVRNIDNIINNNISGNSIDISTITVGRFLSSLSFSEEIDFLQEYLSDEINEPLNRGQKQDVLLQVYDLLYGDSRLADAGDAIRRIVNNR